jgi:hypothetical protein
MPSVLGWIAFAATVNVSSLWMKKKTSKLSSRREVL